MNSGEATRRLRLWQSLICPGGLQTDELFPIAPVNPEPPATGPDANNVRQDVAAEPGGQTISLADLRGLRSAPQVSEPLRLQLRLELEQASAPYSWFTLGVMAPDAETAIGVLRGVEAALGWQPLHADGDLPTVASATTSAATSAKVGSPQPLPTPAAALPVFLKGNQRTGLFQLRPEAGLGEGLLITGQEATSAIASETWGPLPLDLFA